MPCPELCESLRKGRTGAAASAPAEPLDVLPVPRAASAPGGFSALHPREISTPFLIKYPSKHPVKVKDWADPWSAAIPEGREWTGAMGGSGMDRSPWRVQG